MASIVIELLLSRIASALESEASLIAGVVDELASLQQELLWMKSFLEDAYRRNATLLETQRRWVDEVTDMAYSAEDIIDEFMYHTTSSHSNRAKFAKLFYSIICFPQNLWERRRIAGKLQKMKRKIANAAERKERYLEGGLEGLKSLQDQQRFRQLQNYSESCLFFKDEDLVGIKDSRDKLIGWLTGGDAGRSVISVVGMGGSGKTTLVASVYKHQDVRRHFDCWAWITVSQTYDAHDLLNRIIKELHRAENQEVAMDNLSNKTYRELVGMLVNYLRARRYVVVLDDVWDANLWSQISTSLPDEGHGNRVIITTRNQDIASSSFGAVSHVHSVEPLDKGEAWELFCRKAFLTHPNKSCPQGLQTIALDLVARCEGLPLAIVALGGLMSSKNLESSEWTRVRDSLSWELSNNPKLARVKILLLLSFHDLSPQLKCCFLYCCLFPEDYSIGQEKLTKLWMAEGFVGKVTSTRAEEVAERYLMELISRGMLQVTLWEVTGTQTKCKMHDLLRELALDISKAEKFCARWDQNHRGDAIEEINGTRRLSIESTQKALKWQNTNTIMQLRTLFVFSKTLETLQPGLKLLRVLDLEDVPIVKLPEDVVDLFNLRYLNLRGTKVKELPKSIGRLRNLQTLDVRNSGIRVLPNGVTRLHNLQHLLARRSSIEKIQDFDYSSGAAVAPNICKLKKLQILAGVDANAGLMRQARHMTQLTWLGIHNLRETDEEDLINGLQNMKLLRYLGVMVSDEDEYLRIDRLSSPPPCLEGLGLCGKLERVPRWLSSLRSLTHLRLHWSRLKEDPLPYINALPNLEALWLVNAYTGPKLCFSNGFRKLNALCLVNLSELNEIIMEEGVMPGLQLLWLNRCMELKMLPHGIQFLTNLQTLRLSMVSDQLIQGIEREGTLDHQNVPHIPHITCYNREVGYRKIVVT